jgi:hypothetical protein
LLLVDLATLEIIDMKQATHVRLSENSKRIRILYGDHGYIQNALKGELPLLGNPYPNPSQGEVSIPFHVPENADKSMVKIKIYDSHGTEINMLVNDSFARGTHHIKWFPGSAPGLYIVRMWLGQTESRNVKIIVK